MRSTADPLPVEVNDGESSIGALVRRLALAGVLLAALTILASIALAAQS